MIQNLFSDMRYAIRAMRRAPLFTAIAVASLALGLGANTAIFSLFDQILLRPAAVRNPHELVMLDSPGGRFGRSYGPYTFPHPMYKDLQDHNTAFSGLLARAPVSVTVLQGDGQGLKVDSEMVSGNYFKVLGINAQVGRTLMPSDDLTPGAHPVVVLSDEFWRSHYAADQAVVGRTIRLNGHPFEVVGVSQQGFRGIEMALSPGLFVPMMMKAQITPTYDGLNDRRTYFAQLFGRLKPGLSRQQAQAALQPYFHQLIEEDVKTISGMPASFRTRYSAKELVLSDGSGGMPTVRRDVTLPMFILMSMVGLVLLIACANVANLLMARAASRQREIALRLALGASRMQLIRQLLVESTMLAMAGGVAGLLIASWTLEALRRTMGSDPTVSTIVWQLDLRAMLFLFVIAVVSGLAFGLLPALQATRPDLAPSMKDTGSVSASTAALRSKRILVVAQVALSLLLLIGSGLFLRSLSNLSTLDPGFRTENLISFSVDAPLSGFKVEQGPLMYESLQERLSAIPGVNSVSIAENYLLSGANWSMTVKVQGYQAKEGEDINPTTNTVSQRFFANMGIPLAQGREFSRMDTAASPKVAIVNESFVKHYFGAENPLGRRFGFGDKDSGVQIVGVVKDRKMTSLREDMKDRVYLPVSQGPELSQVTFYVRTFSEPDATIQTLRRETAAAYPGLAFFDPKTMKQQIRESLTSERLVAGLCAAFGSVATLLAALGLYGVMAWSVARRTRELGIRTALGAEQGRILTMVLKEVAILAGIGIAIGLPVSLSLTRLVRTQLFGLAPTDPLTMTAAMAVLFVVALLAGYIPARRASRVDPLVALRYE